MKKIFLALAAFACTAMPMVAQTLSVKVGGVTYQYPAQKVGDMNYMNGERLSVLDRTFLLSDVQAMNVDIQNQFSHHNTVNVSYETGDAAIYILTEQSADQAAGSNLGFYSESNQPLFNSSLGGIRLNFQMSGITKVELESVDNNPLAGNHDQSIITLEAPEGETLVPGKDYFIATFPCDVYGGYRLSIYKGRDVAPYFGVHQVINAGEFITPSDLVESDLVFADIDAPFVEDERPALDAATKQMLVAYQKNPTEENKQVLMNQMGVKYDKVVARKKAKLRQLEREAKTPDLVAEMQAIVDEMVDNRDTRLEQQFWRLVDPRVDDNPSDQWLVLRGSSAKNAYIAYAPVTNKEYAAYNPTFTYPQGQDNYPAVNVSYDESVAYCNWMSTMDAQHAYRLPSEEEWILAAGHMPKDVKMNSDYVEKGLTAVDAYAETTGACGGIDFWGNSWEWTSTQNTAGLYIVKGGSWDSSRDACRSEYSDDVRDASGKYANVGFRVVRVDL